MTIAISKKGGHIVFSDFNRNVEEETISEDKADELAKKFLNSKGFTELEKTYYTKQGGIMTINYAYEQDDVLVENVEKLIERNSKMDIIVTKSNNLKDMSVNVSNIADAIRRNESSRKNKYVIVACVLVGVLIIMFIFLK